MKAIILAAGQGIRLGDISSNRPKCLIRINEKSILEIQTEILTKNGIKNISIVIGVKGTCWTQETYNEVKKIQKNIVFNFDNDKTHNAYSALLALNESEPEDTLLIDGDLLMQEGTLLEVLRSKKSNILLTKLATNRGEIGCRVVEENYIVVDLGKTIVPVTYPWDIHSGLIKISKESIEFFKHCLEVDKFKSREIEFPLRKFIKEEELSILRTEQTKWININTPSDYKAAQETYK